jgi:sialate O-acetylesterase
MRLHVSLLATLACILQFHPATADVSLPKIIDSHMVLQQDLPLNIWGWAEAGEEVTVELGKNKATAKTDAEGNWKVTLPAMKADGKAHQMTISGKNKIVLEDILIGEVWLGSGQSNMQWALNGTTGGKEAAAAADLPNIRLFHVPRVKAKAPAKDVKAKWTVCKPGPAGGFSAVLFYMGNRLHKELEVPIGLIHSSWGGSLIEPWMPVAKGGTAGMYNAMIAPIHPFSLRGIIWYQGESNVLSKKDGMKYLDKKKALIESWRAAWGHDFSFYFVQIAPWQGRYGPGQLPALWEAQSATMKLPKTGMAVITDLVDNIRDIHPRNKLPVGNRLASWALAKDYGKEDEVYSGPHYKSSKIEGAKVIVSFSHTDGGLKARDDKPLNEFEIAGEDGMFVAAEATIDGDTVVVQSKDVAAPTQVRFGWRNVANPNLMNGKGLPASPFRTKDWKGWTAED